MIRQINKTLFFSKLIKFVFICFCNIHVFANPSDSLRKMKIGVLPSAFYTPETRLGFGGLLYTHFKIRKTDSLLRRSNTQSYLSYTMNKQFALQNDYQIWLKGNLFYLTGAADLSRFPEYFFGIGNATKKTDKFMVSFDLIRIQTKNLICLKNNVYAGVFFHYQRLYNQHVNLPSNSLWVEAHGSMGYTAKGIGPIFIVDTRNNPLNPGKGVYLEASYVDYKNVLDNENMFTSLTIDARKYYTFFNRLVWNGNAYLAYNNGEVPFRMLPEIGGPRFLRGYYRGRFRDNNLAVVQHEFRMPVYKLFGVAVFGGLGSVAQSIHQFKTNTIHYNYGVGLRIRINKKEDTNVRIDYGFTKDSRGLYVVFAEAF